MGNLKPNTSYIYERADGVTYAREVGDSQRFPIGWDYVPTPTNTSTVFGVPTSEITTYIDMLEIAKENPALQEALDRAKLIYHLSKEDGKEQVR